VDDIAVISPPPSFGSADHETLAKVAQVPGSKILDCTRIAAVPMNIAAVATAGWAAPRGSVPRLAIVLEIDVWALARMMAAAPIAALRAQGTELRVLYRTQLEAGHVHTFIRNGTEPPLELATTLEQLDEVWTGSPLAANVIDAFQELVNADTSDMRPLHFARLASVAVKFSDQGRALTLTRQALRESMGRNDAIATQANQIAMALSQRLLQGQS
jgi:hypothetical protein